MDIISPTNESKIVVKVMMKSSRGVMWSIFDGNVRTTIERWCRLEHEAGRLCSLFDLLDLTPVEFFFKHNSGRLDVPHQAEYAVANPEEDDHKEDANGSVGVQPLVDVLVGTVGTEGSSPNVPNSRSLRVSNRSECHHGSNQFLKHLYKNYNKFFRRFQLLFISNS